MKKNIFVFIVLLLSIISWGCKTQTSVEKVKAGKAKLKIYASFYTLADFTKKIAGEKAEVINLVPAGIEPHDFEPSPRTLIDLAQGDLFVYNGLGLEPWADKFLSSVGSGKLNAVLASQGIKSPLRDPHIWLDPVYAQKLAENIKNGLVAIDPQNKNYYMANYKELQKKLEKLDVDFRNALSPFRGKAFVVSHNAFSYLANRYGLKELPIMGISPDAEPTPADLARLSEIIKKNNIKYICFEELLSPKTAQTLANETGAKIIVLNPLEGLTLEQEQAGEDYFSIMHKNLQNLIKAVGAKQ